jgi:hypothetical protein
MTILLVPSEDGRYITDLNTVAVVQYHADRTRQSTTPSGCDVIEQTVIAVRIPAELSRFWLRTRDSDTLGVNTAEHDEVPL